MQSFEGATYGSLDAFRWVECNVPDLLTGQVRIRVEATALGFVDGLMVQGRYQIKPPLPYVPGGEIAGVVDAIGAEVLHLSAGSRVVTWQLGGGLSEYLVAPVNEVESIPAELDFASAAAMLVDYQTTHYALFERGRISAGETVLVVGAAGGVGSAAVQLAAKAGAHVIAAASTDEKRAHARALGARATINSESEDIRAEIRANAPEGVIDVVVDPVGGPAFEALFRSLAKEGRHLVIGFAGGGIPALPLHTGASMTPICKGRSTWRCRQPNRSVPYRTNRIGVLPFRTAEGHTTVAYRILSLDGGGAWALIQVKTLMALFGDNARGHAVLGSFDLAAANSGGSLTLAGLTENKRLSEILDMFKDKAKRRSIFSPARSPWRPIYKLIGIGPKYSTAAKLMAIHSLLPMTGNKVLPDVAQTIPGRSGQPVHLLIVGFDYDTNRAMFFRSAEVKDRPVWGSGASANSTTLAEAVHVSTNAPINYFDAPAAISGALDRFWDGGITGCNNPAVAATIEAITQDIAAADIRLLSIGTGTVFLPFEPAQPPFTTERRTSSFVRDLQKLATAILDDPPDIASYIAYAITRDRASAAPYPDRVVRMNPLIAPRRTADGWATYADMTKEAFAYLCRLDMDAVEQAQVAAIESYCDLWLVDRVPNQPIRMDSATLEPEIGQARFSQAKDAWEKISA